MEFTGILWRDQTEMHFKNTSTFGLKPIEKKKWVGAKGQGWSRSIKPGSLEDILFPQEALPAPDFHRRAVFLAAHHGLRVCVLLLTGPGLEFGKMPPRPNPRDHPSGEFQKPPGSQRKHLPPRQTWVSKGLVLAAGTGAKRIQPNEIFLTFLL